MTQDPLIWITLFIATIYVITTDLVVPRIPTANPAATHAHTPASPTATHQRRLAASPTAEARPAVSEFLPIKMAPDASTKPTGEPIRQVEPPHALRMPRPRKIVAGLQRIPLPPREQRPRLSAAPRMSSTAAASAATQTRASGREQLATRLTAAATRDMVAAARTAIGPVYN